MGMERRYKCYKTMKKDFKAPNVRETKVYIQRGTYVSYFYRSNVMISCPCLRVIHIMSIEWEYAVEEGTTFSYLISSICNR